jgi:hypothetical protein
MSKAEDKLWEEHRVKYKWQLPKKANWFLRLPVIRYCRWFTLNIKATFHNDTWGALGLIPSGYDAWVLYAIYKGKC